MQSQIRLSNNIQDLLRCPICHAKLKKVGEQFECNNSKCATCFPIVDGIPVLINDNASVFSIADFTSASKSNDRGSSLKKTIKSFIPKISNNIK